MGVAVAAAERRLTRLRFDLHDGPQQDVVLLAEDLSVLRAELEAALAGQPAEHQVLALVDQLQAKLVSLDADLRRLAAFVQSPFNETESVPDALADISQEFGDRSGIKPELHVEGDFSVLSDSQRITLLSLIREALANVREHSQARRVQITVSSTSEGLEAKVADDGRGFDPEVMLAQAARGGHLGLVGMYERVSLLGGKTTIESRAGGPTVVSIILPAWPPSGGAAG